MKKGTGESKTDKTGERQVLNKERTRTTRLTNVFKVKVKFKVINTAISIY